MLKLRKLHLRNFLSHTDSEIDLSSNSGLVLISGKNSSGLYDSNGSGKSTILEGVVYALTGNTLRGLGVNDVVNRNVKKDTCVSLSFETEESTYRIDRYRKDTSFGDKIDLWEISEGSEENISKRLNKDTQSLIDNIVDIPYDVLVNTIFLGEGLSSRFTQLSDPDKKSLIESTLNLSYDLDKSKNAANDKLKSLKLGKSNLEGQKMTIDSLLSTDISTIQSEINKLMEDRDRTNSELTSQSDRKNSLEQEISMLSPKIEVLRNSIQSYETLESNLKIIDTSVANLVNELTSVESAETPLCTVCKQRLSSEDSMEALRDSYKDKIEEGSSQMRELVAQIDALPPINTMRDKFNILQEEYKTKHIEYQSVVSCINTLSTQVVHIDSQINSKNQLCVNHKEYEEKSKRISSDINSIDRDIHNYEYFYKLFSPTGIITIILEEAISYINERIKSYTSLLLDKTYQLILSKGKLSLLDDKGSTYQSLSNGEKRRLDIAIQFSLHDYTHIYCGIGTNLLFIDEVLDTLDTTGVNNIIEVLNLKREYCSLNSIYVITHNSELKSYFDKVITVSKDSNGNSHIES